MFQLTSKSLEMTADGSIGLYSAKTINNRENLSIYSDEPWNVVHQSAPGCKAVKLFSHEADCLMKYIAVFLKKIYSYNWMC